MQRERFIYEGFRKKQSRFVPLHHQPQGSVRNRKIVNQDSQYRKQMKPVVFRIKKKKSKRNRLDKVGNAPASSTQDADSKTGTYLAILQNIQNCRHFLNASTRIGHQIRSCHFLLNPSNVSFTIFVHSAIRLCIC
jgi:hypothetical protein